MDKVKTGALIREARIKKNLTQCELGDLIGVTNKAVSRWENGESFPDVGVIEKLSEVLDIRIQDIITGDEKINDYKEEQMEKILSDVIHSMKQDRRKMFFNITMIAFLTSFLMTGIRKDYNYSIIHDRLGANSWIEFPVRLMIFFLIMMICGKFILRSLPDTRHKIFEKRNNLQLTALAAGLIIIPVIILLSIRFSSAIPEKPAFYFRIAAILPFFISYTSFINELSTDDFSLYKLVLASSTMFLVVGYKSDCSYIISKEIFFRNIILIPILILAETVLMILFIRKRIYR